MARLDDNYKNTERILYDYKVMKGYIELRKKDLAELKYQGVSAISLSLAKPSNTKTSDPVSEEFLSVEKIKARWEQEIKRREEIIYKVDYAISLLKEHEKKIVKLRYIEGKTHEQISAFVDYSPRQVMRIRKKCIQKISMVLFD